MTEGIRDKFHDAVAFCRAVHNKDYEGAQILWELHPHKLDIAMPQATIIGSLVNRIQHDFGVPETEIWAMIIQAVEEMETDDESPEDGE